MSLNFSSLLDMLDRNKHSKESIKSPVFEDNDPMPTPADPKAYQAFMSADEDMRNDGESTELLMNSVVNPPSQSIFDTYAPDSGTEEEAYAGESEELPQLTNPIRTKSAIQDKLVAEQFINKKVIDDIERKEEKPSDMAEFWGDIYQSQSNKGKMRKFDRDQEDFKDINSQARNDIANASQLAGDIFSGDEGGVKGHKLAEILNQTALHESSGGYYDEQKGGGPAKGYWQVEPKTARDLLKNSSAYFGPKAKRAINEAMGREVDIQNLSDAELTELLKTPMGGAIFAGAKYIAGAKSKKKLDFLK